MLDQNKKVVVVDVISKWGHNALNSEILTTLQQYGCTVDFIGNETHRTIVDGRGLNNFTLFKPIREEAFDGPIFGRLRLIEKLQKVAKIIRKEKYDIVLFSAFDELAMLFWPNVGGKLLLIAHGNISGGRSSFKRFALKRIVTNAHLLVFHDFIRTRAKELGVPSVSVMGQGLTAPYSKIQLASLEQYLPVQLKSLAQGQRKTIVFVPSVTKYSDDILLHTLLSPQMDELCSRKGIHFIIKGGKARPLSHVTMLPQFISKAEYQAVFQLADTVVLGYPSSFDYRLSAVFIECISNNKPCVVSEIDCFRALSKHFRYNPYFGDCGSLVRAIGESTSIDHPFFGTESFILKIEELLNGR